jgi:hypothetical protein
MDELRTPLINMIENMSDNEINTLFEVQNVAHKALIYETSEEKLIMDQFLTSLWIAARGKIFPETKSEHNNKNS